MITITVTITSNERGLELTQIGSAGEEGADADECRAGDIISQGIHAAFEECKQEGDIKIVPQPYTRIQGIRKQRHE